MKKVPYIVYIMHLNNYFVSDRLVSPRQANGMFSYLQHAAGHIHNIYDDMLVSLCQAVDQITI